MSDTSQSGVRRISGSGVSDTEISDVAKKIVNEAVDTSATSGGVSRASGDTNAVVAPTTTISTIAVQSGDTRIVLALLQSGEWLELRVVELSPGLVYLGSTLEEASALQKAHLEVLTKLQSQQSPVEDLLNQADQLISTQRPRAEVYAAMAESLGLAWRDLNSHLETRKNLLDLSVTFHTRARQYSDAMDAAEKVYTDNVMPTDVEAAKRLLTTLHDHKRGILESSMYTLQEAHVLLGRLKGLLHEGGSMDSRPQHIRTNIEFACSQIEHYLESLHDRRRFLDGLYSARKHHLEQCLALCVLYQDLTEAILNLKKLRDEISDHQDLGTSQANAEILLHEHLRRENAAKAQQDQCVRHVRTAEQMVASGHYAGAEARARAYSVLEAATALHETCDTRTALLEQAALFFKLATGALTKLDQAEVQVAGLSTQGGNQRLSVVMGVVEEAVQPALTEGYALLEVTGGRGQPHNQGVTEMVEQLENRRTRLSSLCAESTEKVLQKTELINSFLEMYNAIESWLIKIGDSFLRGHQDPGGSLSLAKDFLHLHLTLKNDLLDKSQEIDTVSAFLDQLSKELPDEELIGYRDKVENIRKHWSSLNGILESRIKLSENYVKFHEDAEKINSNFEDLELLLKNAKTESDNQPIEEKWQKIQQMYQDLLISGKQFIKLAKESDYPYLDINRAILCVEYILENLGKRKLVVTDLFTHYKQKISVYKELISLWNTYKENLKKMEIEMQNLEESLCPLLRGDPSKPENLVDNLESRLSVYVKAVRSVQEDIQNMVTKAEVLAHNDEAGAERPEIVRSFLQLYQNLQNKATDYQILGTMLIQWCKNISEVHRSCDKMERQFGGIPPDASGVEKQLRELDASKHAVSELLKFAQHEADAIIQKIRVQCPYEAGGKDIAKMKEMLERRRKVMEENWTERQTILERLLKKSHYQTDLKVIRDQLRDLNDQLNRMKGHYGDSLNAALNMRTAFNHFKQSVDVLGRRINNFVSTAEKVLFDDEDSKSIQMELNDLQNKWSTFQMQVGSSQKNIELSIEFFKLIDEAESWFKEGSQLLITVAGESSQIQTPEHANKLQQKIESFLNPGEVDQSNRITKISSLAFQLYGDTTPQQVEAVSQQNTFMLESFNVINKNLETLMRNLKTAEEQRRNQEKEQQELAASLAQAQVEAESARLAALAAEEARKVAEETVTAMAMRKITTSETVEVVVQTDPEPEPEPQIVHEELPPVKKVKVVEEEEEEIFSETLIPPMFLTPLVGATVTEGVKFTFECRVTGTPTPEVEWLKDGLSIMSNPDYRTYFDGNVCALTIEETFVEDSAFFTCRAQNKCGTAESSATLIVKESVPTEVLMPPSFSKRLSDFTVQEGSSFQLEANVTGHPLPVVSWSKNSICIDHSPDYIITYNNGECILRFEEVFMEDEAEYTCRATNDLGEDVTRAKLSVTATVASEKPSFPVPLSNLMARAGQKFKLECEVKGTPTPSLAWFHNNKQVKETPDCKISFDGKIASLIISEAFPKNAGKYTLVAKNTAGEAKTFSSVSVKGRIPTETSDSEITSDIDAEPIKPSVQQALKDVLAKEGDTIRLDCIIIGQPEPEVIWYHDDKPVKESEDIRLLFHGDRCSLVIEEAFIEDIGEYKVVAMNSAGEASTSCNVSVEVPEKVPVPPPAEISVIALPPPAEPPRFSHLLVDTHVMEGEPVVLKASVSGSPNPTIAWFRDGVPVLPDDTLQIYEEPDGFVKIYIPRTNLDHTGQYEVIASNCAGTAKCIGFLSIEQRLPSPEPKEPPGFTKLLEDVTVESGNSISLEAEVTGKPKPLVYWTLNNSPIDEFEYLHGVKQYNFEETSPGKYCFKISNVSRAQDGRVAIVAENDVGKAVSACNLNVYDPPILVSTTPPPPPSTETFEKRTIISETHVTKVVSSSSTDVGTPQQQSYEASTSSHISRVSGQPTVEVHGSRVQEVKQEGPSEPKVSEKVNIIKVEDGHVVEELSTDSSKVPFEPAAKKLVPKRKSNPARFLTPLQGIILKENERAFFECVIDGYPEPSIKWTHNGNPVSGDALTSVDGNRVSLVIPQVGQHHSGRYTCSIDNEAGSAQCTCDLVVRKIQFPPVFSKRLQPSVIGVGERLHLEVDVSGTPAPEVSWSKNGQPLQSTENLIIKTEGSRSWLVIPEAKESDSGRYGVVASNGAGRAECLADVMVTSLSITEPKSIITFTDISDDSRNQIGFVGAERVKTFTKLIETTSKETSSPIIPVSFTKIDKDITDQVPLATPATLQPSPEPSVEIEEKKLPGKLRLSWPPQEPEEDIRQKLDLEISTNKVSNIISSFNTISESETVLGEEQPLLFEKVDAKVWNPSITPEPEPQYGYIEVTPSVDHLIPPDQEAEQEKSITPEFNIPSSSEFETFDGDLSDNILSTPATSDYYPKTSPSVEVELAERFHQISEEPEISQAISEIPEETETKEDMEVRTEKHSRESSYTEIKKSVSSTEKTIVETRVYREYDDETGVPEIKKSSPILQREEIVEYIAPKTTEVIEHKAVPIIDQNGAAETLPSQDFEVKTPLSHSYTASEKSSSFSSREAHSSYISSSQVETKVYPQRDQTPGQQIEIKTVSDEFTSGDEFSRSPIPPDGVSNEKRMKKKRESVKQIALRLEETIIPMSPEEVPGGIRMFPPKPSTPSIEPPTTKDVKINESEDIEDKVKISFSEFPKLEPFPFSVEERPKVEKPKGPPPPMPKKFIPGTFTDSECESDLDIPIGEKFVPKKIKFEAKSASRVRSSSESEPPPPSSFDKPPVIEGMRPEILKMEEIQPEPKLKKPLVDLPKKKPKIVQKFLTKATDQHLEMTKPKPSPQSVTKVENKEFIHETKIFEEKIVKESETPKPVSKKLEKIWPPPEPIIVSSAIEDLKMLKSIGTEEEKPEKQIAPEQPIKIISASPTQQISETLQKEKVIFAPIKSYESSFKAEAVTPATVLQEIPSEINQSMTFTSQSSFLQTTASGFKSVKAPSPVPKKEKPLVISSPAPPFDISPTVITPVVTSESTMKTSQVKDSYQKKELIKESHVKSFVSAKKETKLWPPVQTEVKLGEIRSHSLERPPVTVAPSLPLTAHEAPPAIYWSSSITLKEKRHSLPLEYMDTSSTVLQQESISQQQYKSLQRSTDIKRVKIQEPLVKPQEKPKTNILQRKPTPASIKPISNIVKAAESKETQEQFSFEFKPMPKLEPFPFVVEEKKERVRQYAPPPPKPTKFIPGSFTESDYESDYEGKPPSIWRPYMSDTETSSFKPVRVKLKQGRHRRPKVPSPPAPTEFEIPPKDVGPLRPSVSLSDLEGEETFIEKKPLQMTPIKCKFTKKTSKPKTPAIIKPIPIRPTQPIHIISPPAPAVNGPIGISQTRPVISAPPPASTLPFSHSQEKAVQIKSSTIQQTGKIQSGVTNLKDQYQIRPGTLGKKLDLGKPQLKTSAFSSQSSLETSATSSKRVNFITQSGSGVQKISTSTPNLSSREKIVIPVKREPVPLKPSSPKLVKKTSSQAIGFEESGYTADTESTLPRKLAKSQAFSQTSNVTSFSKSESHSACFSSKSESKNYHSKQFASGDGFTSFPGGENAFNYTFSASGGGIGGGFPPSSGEIGGGFPPRGGGIEGGFSSASGGIGGGFPPGGGPPGPSGFPSQTFPTFNQSGTSSSFFSSSESKSSQYYSTTKTEEIYEKRSGTSEDTHRDSRPTQQEERKPKFEEFRRETKGKPGSFGPFSEDTYYSMSDESETVTGKDKKKTKVEMKKESHVQTMSDKKSEYYSYSSSDNAERPKKESPKSMKKKMTKFDTPEGKEPWIKTEIVRQLPVKHIKTETLESHEKSGIDKKIEIMKPFPEKKIEIMKSFPFKTATQEEKKPKVPTSPKSTRFIKIETEESEIKVPPLWKTSDSDKTEPSYTKVFSPKLDRKSQRMKSPSPPSKYEPYPKFEDAPRPVIEFPDSEPELTPRYIKDGREPPQIIPKEDIEVKAKAPPQKYEPRRSPSPVLIQEPPPEEGFIPPPKPFSNAFGVESKKVTKIEDSSQFHKRFVTMEQTTRLIKLTDAGETTPTYTSKFQSKPQKQKTEEIPKYKIKEITLKEIPKFDEKPLPKLEPFPFSVSTSSTIKKERGPPPPVPKRFIKGELRESDYESDSDIHIKPVWNPPDSDAEDISYGKVEPPIFVSKVAKISKERTPTPPSIFDDKPPPTGEPMRPSIEPVEVIKLREVSPEYIIPTEISLVEEKELAKVLATRRPSPPMPPRQVSPPLPPPGSPPVEGIIIPEVTDGIMLSTEHPDIKPSPKPKKKPYREIVERTERQISDQHYTEERTFRTGKVEIVKTIVREFQPEEARPTTDGDLQFTVHERKLDNGLKYESKDLKEVSQLEPFPFRVEETKPKKQKLPPPPQPRKFEKVEMSESGLDSDLDEKIPVLWKPPDSDVEEPSYSKIEVSLPKGKRAQIIDQKYPTPPSVFDKGPAESELLKISQIEVIPDTQTVKITPIQKMSVETQRTETKLEQKFQKLGSEKVFYQEIPKAAQKPTQAYVEFKEKVDVKSTPKKRYDIDIDIVDIYDYASESETERIHSEIGSYKTVPDLEPFPYTPDPQRPKRERGPPPPMPKKFMKGEFKESDYESEYEGKIPPKWGPTDSESEGLSYRKVKPPETAELVKKPKENGKLPHPPSSFDFPPAFEGPPRPIVDLHDIPRRERRESLEEYSIPKFPKVEFRPFELDDETVKKTFVQTTDTETTDTEAVKDSLQKSLLAKQYAESAQQYVGEKLGDMSQTFRSKAHLFAEQLVSEVFAGKDGTTPTFQTEPEAIEQIHIVEKPKERIENGLDVRQPQSYRDESRISEFGSKHIDPDSGLIYFKYDFGYEFGIVLPGEARKIARSRSVPPGDKSGDIEIPVIHERSDDESKGSKKVKFSSSKGDKGKVLQYSVPKKQSQFQCLPKEPFSDSEAETRIRAHLPHAKPKFVAPYVKPFAPPLPKSSLKRTQPFQKTDRGPDAPLSSPSLVSMATSPASSTHGAKPPAFISTLKDYISPEGEELRLECVVKSSLPTKISWYKNGFLLREGHRCQTQFKNGVCRLILMYPNPDDSGYYTCYAETALGKDSTSTSVVVSQGEAS